MEKRLNKASPIDLMLPVELHAADNNTERDAAIPKGPLLHIGQ